MSMFWFVSLTNKLSLKTVYVTTEFTPHMSKRSTYVKEKYLTTIFSFSFRSLGSSFIHLFTEIR